MGVWEATSKTHVSSMPSDDFYANEKSVTIDSTQIGAARVEFSSTNGSTFNLKKNITLTEGAVLDASSLRVSTLRKFLREEIEDAKKQGILFSIHLKATMMKVSDPILFGHAVSVFLEPVFAKYKERLSALGVNPNAGLGEMLTCVKDD